MSERLADRSLHLPSLSISGFRGINRLEIPRLGRVTLLAGKNGVGKTTVLDAVRVYVSRARPDVLEELLVGRDELETGLDEDRDPVRIPDFAALFHGRLDRQTREILIGPGDGKDAVKVQISSPSTWSKEDKRMLAELVGDLPAYADFQVISVGYRDERRLFPHVLAGNGQRRGRPHRLASRVRHRAWVQFDGWFEEPGRPEIACESLGPGLTDNDRLGRFWDNVALTDIEEATIEALGLILGEGIDRIVLVGEDTSRYGRDRRRPVVRLQRHRHPIPLRSLGDGVTRMFAVGLALANCLDGFLLVDEVENGIHHSVQAEFWKMVLRAARENNVQILASTHSRDCATGFAQASLDADDGEAVLVRLEEGAERMKAVEYAKDELEVLAHTYVEVR